MLDKCDVLMHLAECGLNRNRAASGAGVTSRTFFRAMKRHRVRAPKSNAKLNGCRVKRIRATLGRVPKADIAKQEKVNVKTITSIERGDTWRNFR